MIKRLFFFFWDKSFFRFLFVSAVNTVVGYLLMLFFRYVVGMMDPWPVVMNYVLAFPLAYTLQTKFAFRTEWQLPRMFAYALSSVPSLLLQAFFALIIPEESMVCWLRYALISVLPAPIMYFIIRFIVTPMKKKKEK